jgi:UDP-N-acetylmuramoyl-tripeptide--D-alanyl-D-alanine ligase
MRFISTEDLYRIYSVNTSISTDTRNVKPGDLFFALKGEHFNGNRFAIQAITNGAAYAIIDEEIDGEYPASLTDRLLLVEDVLVSLQHLAGHHRNHFRIPFIAITGSNGKTTTKELIHAVLSEKYKTYTTEGNLNNHIGIPLTLLKIKKDAEMAVVEMGANHLGEIAGYCQYTRPTHGLITNAGKAHIEGFGSAENVKKGKGELYDYLRNSGGTVFAMWDYDYLRDMSRGISKIVTYGLSHADITGIAEPAASQLCVRITSGTTPDSIQTRLTGNYNLPNVLAAVSVGTYFNVGFHSIKKAIENYVPSNSRSQLVSAGTNTVVLDAYNANPSSMKAAIENFISFPSPNKILLLGAMAELGAESVSEHQAIVNLIHTHHWKEVVLVGGDFLKIKHPYKSFTDAKEAGNWIESQHFQDSAFLVKGSRSSKMELAIASILGHSTKT